MTYFFIKNQFEREKFVLFSYKKKKNFKRTKKTKKKHFKWFFWVFWVGFLMPTLQLAEGQGEHSPGWV
jgi:hypothetical protein